MKTDYKVFNTCEFSLQYTQSRPLESKNSDSREEKLFLEIVQMTSFFLLAVELLVILCSQSEVCTVVETSYISVQLYSPHILYRQTWAEKMLFPAG